MWKYHGQKRPPFAVEPAPSQESVWDYPRPPVLRKTSREVIVSAQGRTIAHSREAIRLLETASPPTFYLPAVSVDQAQLIDLPDSSVCEWKGKARYLGLASDPATAMAWVYDNPHERYAALRGFFAFYPGRIACTVDGERVQPQSGYFYGGWITADIAGPFKGDSGTQHW